MCLPHFVCDSEDSSDESPPSLQDAIRTGRMYQQLLRRMQGPATLRNIVEELIFQPLNEVDELAEVVRIYEELRVSASLGFLELQDDRWRSTND